LGISVDITNTVNYWAEWLVGGSGLKESEAFEGVGLPYHPGYGPELQCEKKEILNSAISFATVVFTVIGNTYQLYVRISVLMLIFYEILW